MQRAEVGAFINGRARQVHQCPRAKRDNDQRVDKEVSHIGRDAKTNRTRQAPNQGKHREEKERNRSGGALKHIAHQQIKENLLPHLEDRLRYSKKGQIAMGAEAASRRERPRHKARSHIGHSFEGQQGHKHREVRKALALRHAPGHTAEKGGAGKEAKEKHVVKIDIEPHVFPPPVPRANP